MSPALVCLALGVSLPVAAVGWMAGALLDRAAPTPVERDRFWSVAFWAGPVTAVGALAAPRLPEGALHGVFHLRTDFAASPPQVATVVQHGVPVAVILLIVVAIGAALRLASLTLRLGRLRQIRDRAQVVTGETAGLPVRLSAEVASPLLAGLRRPTILLPIRYGASGAAEAAALVCRHEAAHARRGDNLRFLAEEIAVAVFWFNPLLAAVRNRLSAAREEVCDAVAVADLDPSERHLYARSLLECLEVRATNLPATGLLGLNRRSTTMRIAAILTPTPHRRRAALAGALMAGLAASATAAVALAAAQTPARDQPAVQQIPIDVTAGGTQTDKIDQPSRLTDGRPAPGARPAKPTATRVAIVEAAPAAAAAAPPAAQASPNLKSTAKMGPIDITADRVQADVAQHVQLWIGHASVSGITKETMDGLFIDGRPATEADLANLPQRRFASIKATFNPNGHELDRLDAETKSH